MVINAFSAAIAAGMTHLYHRINSDRVPDNVAPPPYSEDAEMDRLAQSMPPVPVGEPVGSFVANEETSLEVEETSLAVGETSLEVDEPEVVNLIDLV